MRNQSPFGARPSRTKVLAAALGTMLGIMVATVAAGQAGHPTQSEAGPQIPPIDATALDGHTVSLPAALPGRATVLILGFGRHSADATTAWEKPIRSQLAHPPAIGFYDMAMLAAIPSFAHSFALHALRKQVPDVLKPNFLPLFNHEDEWKRAAGYTADQPEAAYLMLVDAKGTIRWSTHEAFSPAGFARLREAAQRLAGE